MTVEKFFTIDPWPHQRNGVEQTIAKLSNGSKSVCLTSPTGSGKSLCMVALTRWALESGNTVLLFTNRILLTDQTRKVFQKAGVPTGVISASMPQYEREDVSVNIATIQTILSRRRSEPSYWAAADLVIADEVHQVASGDSAELLNAYKERGSKVLGVTATPLGVSSVCDELIVAAGTRDLQDQGILCFAWWFAPTELDTRNLVKGKVDLSLTENEARKTWGPLRGGEKSDTIRTRIVGNILEHYKRLHPEQRHTLAFAPGVKESLWAAQYCDSQGIRALHIDGTDFWFDGAMYDRKTNEKEFQIAMQAWRDGCISIIWNRFVMREGIDEPQIECLMLATPVGSYRSFLQMVGRGLRVSEETPHQMKVLDFGGNWWRHGSPNVNVDWEDVFDCLDPDVISKNRISQIRETGEPVGYGCPKCGMIHKGLHGRLLKCQFCGEEFGKSKPSRPILQADGTLTQVNGDPITQWKIRKTDDVERMWKGLYWNASKHKDGDVTFNQLYAQVGYLTAVEAGTRESPAYWKAYYPPRDLPLMPQNRNDWHRKVSEVPMENLR